MDSILPATVKNGGDTQVNDSRSNVAKEVKPVPHDLSNKPVLARCTRSRFVHHASSFSYKRMLPFLMKNEISAQGSDRVKIRRVEEIQLASSGVDDLSGGQQHLAVSDDSSQECNKAQIEMMEEEKPPKADENHVLDELQPAVPEASPPDCCAVEVQNVMQQEALDSSLVLSVSSKGELTSDRDGVQAAEQHQLVVSEESPEECKIDEVKRSIQDEAARPDGSYVPDSREFQPAVSEVSPENSMAEVQKAAQEPLPLDGVEENSDKGDHPVKEQPQPCVTKESLTEQMQVQASAEFNEAPQCLKSYSGCHDVDYHSPTKPVVHRRCAQEPQDSISFDDQPFDDDIQMICRPSDPCAASISLSVEEMSGCTPPSEPGSSKAGILRPRGAHTMDKKVLSPRKLSPKKGILKRHTRGCKGICMCLDCCTFRLHADRAFEFSRKQMQEADDIISNLLKEVANLRSLVEKPAGQISFNSYLCLKLQRESTQAACKRASRVEEVARSRCQQMFVDLNAHCRIPGPRVRFAQYIEEKKASSSPRSSNRR
ncbi:hypothetical protein U9M48_020393 [Paspalum notatum var. saurae]|uniref:Uncharacterized protein n=1 Tax=Paspalum notatum var. saurae TaxID=547442 RepID=A0AAQ3WSL1_PASNO